MKIILTEEQLRRLNNGIVTEQIDTEDDEKELMSQWYGDDEDDEDEFDYAPEYDMDSEDSYDLSHSKDIENRMNRSVRVGNAGSDSRETKKYVIDGKDYFLTPIEYRRMLKDMGRITPEKAAMMGIDVDTSGVIRKNSDETGKKIKYLEKRIRNIQRDIDRWEPEIDPNYKDDRLEWKVKYLKASLETAMDEYDELTGNANGEEYDF